MVFPTLLHRFKIRPGSLLHHKRCNNNKAVVIGFFFCEETYRKAETLDFLPREDNASISLQRKLYEVVVPKTWAWISDGKCRISVSCKTVCQLLWLGLFFKIGILTLSCKFLTFCLVSPWNITSKAPTGSGRNWNDFSQYFTRSNVLRFMGLFTQRKKVI